MNNNWVEIPSLTTFMGMPSGRPYGASTRRACIVGIPFDCGTHPFRVGAREAPDSIRKQSRLLRQYEVDPQSAIDNPTEFLEMFDAGNIKCTPSEIKQSFHMIEEAIKAIINENTIPITMGGDGSVTLPQLRAVSNLHKDLVVIHIDAHTDTYDVDGFNTASTFTRAAEEKLIDLRRSFHIGARGTTFTNGVFDFGRSLGYNIIPFSQFDADPSQCIKQVKETIGERPVYLCFDMDIFDPSCAPGVCTPEWGGLSAKEGFALLRALRGLNFVAFDVNTVSPAQDVGDGTAFLAAAVMRECCALAAESVRTYPDTGL